MAKMGIDRNTSAFQRVLVYIPIVHTETDMGGMSAAVQRTALRLLSVRDWRRKSQAVDSIWTEIEQAVERLALCCERVRIYQDGLPVCGRELEIVTDLAQKGSRNHRLLLMLIGKGASLMGTESAELLLEEYEHAKRAAAVQRAGRVLRTPLLESSQGGSLIERRDRFIAARINGTLRRGETGVLFLGMLHSLDNLLAGDIRVAYVPWRPSYGEGDIGNE